MTLTDVGFAISGILFFLSGGLLIFGSYVSYKDFNNLQSEPTPVNLITKYHLSGAIGIGLSAFILLTVAIGSTWENLGFSVVLAIVILGFSALDNFVRLRTTRFLKRRK